MNKIKNHLPIVVVMTCLIAQALEPIIVKWSYKLTIPVFDLLVFRFIAGGIVILPFCLKFKWVGIKEFKKLLPVCALFLGVNVLTYLSLQTLSAITVITCVTTTPSFVALVNKRKGKDQLGKSFWPGLMISIFGVLLTIELFSKGVQVNNSIGILYMALAIAGSTFYRTSMDGLTQKHGARLISNYIFLSNGLLALLLLPFVNLSSTGQMPLSFGLWLGFAAVVANISFLWAIKVLGSTKISIWGIMQRPLMVVVSAVWLGERLTAWQVTGLVLVIVGIQLAKVKKKDIPTATLRPSAAKAI